MNKNINIKIKTKYTKKYQNGYPLLTQESIENLSSLKDEGTLINLLDNNGIFIAKAYYGKQNKGLGWVLSTRQDEHINIDYFSNKIKLALKYREDFYRDINTNAFRVFNGEGDGIGGFTIDYFNEYYLITWYSLGIYKFQASIVEALKREANFKGIYQKKRFDTKGQYLDEDDNFIYGEKTPSPLIILENSIKFAVFLDDGPMVGIFLDQRDVRQTIKKKYTKKMTLLNTFSYTGAFSVVGAVGGATTTTSVDLAKRSRPKTKEQFELNSLPLTNNYIVVEDVFNYFKFAVRKKLTFDVVVVDPPSFARSKKVTFSVSKDYIKLLKEVISITKKGGLVVASTNYANLSMDKFKEFANRAFSDMNIKYKTEEVFTLPKDFKVIKEFSEGNYLKVLFLRRLD